MEFYFNLKNKEKKRHMSRKRKRSYAICERKGIGERLKEAKARGEVR
jgi:hypothetical protein